MKRFFLAMISPTIAVLGLFSIGGCTSGQLIETVEIEGFEKKNNQSEQNVPIDSLDPTDDQVALTALTFSADIFPIFKRRSCNVSICHGTQKAEGDLNLSTIDLAYKAITLNDAKEKTDTSGEFRINTITPTKSLILTETQTDSDPISDHPTVQGWSESDDDYKTILAWIKGGLSK